MTKTEYAETLKGERWQALRKEFLEEHLECERCHMPRWLVSIAYDQDLHAHHKSYANQGKPEEIQDLEALCRRCHDLETFGRSDLREIRQYQCEVCGGIHWDPRTSLCSTCQIVLSISESFHFWMTMRDPRTDEPLWKEILWQMCYALHVQSGADSTADQILSLVVELTERLRPRAVVTDDGEVIHLGA